MGQDMAQLRTRHALEFEVPYQVPLRSRVHSSLIVLTTVTRICGETLGLYCETLPRLTSASIAQLLIVYDSVWWIFYVCLTIFFTSRWAETAPRSGQLLVPREFAKKIARVLPRDEEAAPVNDEKINTSSRSSTTQITPEANGQLIRNTSVFTWKNLTYTVSTPHGPRVLLNNVHGWVKPGMLGALMGSSGAGKTTLLDVLAQRKVDGTIHGDILVDGRPLSVSFQRSAGYCEQLDVHESLA